AVADRGDRIFDAAEHDWGRIQRNPVLCHVAARPPVGLPGPALEDLADCRLNTLQLVVARVEVGRDTDARPGPVVDEELAPQQLARDLVTVRDVECHGPPPQVGSRGRHGAPAEFGGALEETADLPDGLAPDGIDPDPADDLEPGPRSVERGDRRRAVEETE